MSLSLVVMWTVCWSTTKKHVYWRSPCGKSQWDRPVIDSVMCYEQASKTGRANKEDMLRLESNEWKRHMITAHVGRNCSVLDVGCGRGGDLSKLVHRQVSTYTGVDSSPLALEEACSRAVNLGINACLCLSDMSVDEPIVIAAPSDVGICMFALHYFVMTESSTTRFARFLKLHLKPGAFFLGVCPDPREIMYRLLDEDSADDGTVSLRWIDATAGLYNCKITSDSGDVLVDAKEKLIDWPVVERIIESVANLRLVSLVPAPSLNCSSMALYSAFVFEPIVQVRPVCVRGNKKNKKS